jgi:hypothetical protein
MIPKLMVVKKPKHTCSERLDCHERHSYSAVRQTVVGQSRVKKLLN